MPNRRPARAGRLSPAGFGAEKSQRQDDTSEHSKKIERIDRRAGIEPVRFVMERRMLKGTKTRAEAPFCGADPYRPAAFVRRGSVLTVTLRRSQDCLAQSSLDPTVYDEIVRVDAGQARAAAGELARTEGILAGISSRAAPHAAKQPEHPGATIVVILPDTGERYLSTPLFTTREGSP